MRPQAFIILAHKEPEQVEALLKQLAYADLCHFYLHIDLKAGIDKFLYLKDCFPNVEFVKQYNVQWGTASVLDATLAGIEAILKKDINYSHIHLLSGEDILVKPVKDFLNFFTINEEKNYINYDYFPKHWEHRYTLYHFLIKRKRNVAQSGMFFMYKKLVRVLPFLKRKLPYRFNPYIGSQWWSLSLNTVKEIMDFTEHYPYFLKFMRHVQIPDEMFFQTILMNHLRDQTVVNNTLRYIDWESPERGRPAYLDERDIQKINQTDCFFARKIDYQKNAALYQRMGVEQ